MDINVLPFCTEMGYPQINQKKVRVEVKPCLNSCKACAEGYILNQETKECIEGSECPFPMEKALIGGDYQCLSAGDKFKVQIVMDAKAGKGKK